jgi:hypothetical protein
MYYQLKMKLYYNLQAHLGVLFSAGNANLFKKKDTQLLSQHKNTIIRIKIAYGTNNRQMAQPGYMGVGHGGSTEINAGRWLGDLAAIRPLSEAHTTSHVFIIWSQPATTAILIDIYTLAIARSQVSVKVRDIIESWAQRKGSIYKRRCVCRGI